MTIELLRIEGGCIPLHQSPSRPILPFSVVDADDGAPLVVRDLGPRQADCIVVCQPLGVPASILTEFITKLMQRYRVITWDTRGYPSINDNFFRTDCSLNAHLSDLSCICRNLNVSRATLIGYCTGARFALHAARHWPSLFDRLILVSGRFVFQDVDPDQRSRGQRNSFFARAAEDLNAAKFVSEQVLTLYRSGFYDPAFVGIESPDEFRECIAHVFATPETTQRYARMTLSVVGSVPDTWIGDIKAKTLFLGTEDDETVRPAFVRRAHREMAGSHLIMYPEGGHYAIYKPTCSRQICADILTFIDSESRSRRLQ